MRGVMHETCDTIGNLSLLQVGGSRVNSMTVVNMRAFHGTKGEKGYHYHISTTATTTTP